MYVTEQVNIATVKYRYLTEVV